MTILTPSISASSTRSTFSKLFGERVFSSATLPPAQQLKRKMATVEITDDTGKVIFKQEDVEAPVFWSNLAIKVVASKYFYGQQGSPERERSIFMMVHRVTNTIADWGLKDGYFADQQERDIFYDELTWLCLNQYGAFNSPVWFNVGLFQAYNVGMASRGNWHYNAEKSNVDRCDSQYEFPQASACYTQSVADNMESIMALALSEAMLFKFGSGTGTNLSTLRSSRERMSGGGRPSGPLSFLRIYDQVAGTIKSGGKTRRAAKMNILNVDHGDIEEFIAAKAKEEKKIHDLVDLGYDGSFNGETYGGGMFQNENLSVMATDKFMHAALGDGVWHTKAVTTGEVLEQKDARKMLRSMAEGAWFCGDPGVTFYDTIQAWHTCSKSEPINTCNPCSEFWWLDDTACNLASLNLMKFDRPGGFDVERYRAAVRLFITAQEILVDNASYPTPDIAINSHRFRPLGLGYANLGALLMSKGLPYDSHEGRAIAGSLTAILTGEAYAHSATLAEIKGPFKGLDDHRKASQDKDVLVRSNRKAMMDVMHRHRASVAAIAEPTPEIADLCFQAETVWDRAIALGQLHGYRNSQVTVLAPTGTISFMMDCDTTGIEPDIALVKYKLLAGGGTLKLVNGTVEVALTKLGYDKAQRQAILDHIERHDTIEDVVTGGVEAGLKAEHLSETGLKAEHLAIFDCAFKARLGTRSILPVAHLKMMAAVQPFVSGSISKTVNMPNNCTVEEVEQAYVQAWKMGLKCVAIYRDGSKRSQPLTTGPVKNDGKLMTVEAVVEAAKNLGLHVASPEFIEQANRVLAELQVSKAENKELWARLAAAGSPVRRRLPDTRKALTHKFEVAGHEGYLTVGVFEDGQPGEIFITMAKEGSTIGGLMDSIGTLTSISLQYGVPLAALVKKFSYVRFEPSGFTKHPELRQASSIIDYVFRWLGHTFPDGAIQPESLAVPIVKITKVTAAPPSGNGHAHKNELNQATATLQQDAPSCPVCGHVAVRNGACYLCLNCGTSLGCS
jgi:ribonucleoside-diphosphate reductase alpha chain